MREGTYIDDEQVVCVEDFSVFIYDCLPCGADGIRSNPVIGVKRARVIVVNWAGVRECVCGIDTCAYHSL